MYSGQRNKYGEFPDKVYIVQIGEAWRMYPKAGTAKSVVSNKRRYDKDSQQIRLFEFTLSEMKEIDV